MLASIHATSPGYRLADFLVAFHFSAADAALFTAGAKQIGLN